MEDGARQPDQVFAVQVPHIAPGSDLHRAFTHPGDLMLRVTMSSVRSHSVDDVGEDLKIFECPSATIRQR